MDDDDDGAWEMIVLAKGNLFKCIMTEEYSSDGYLSDVVIFNEGIKWAVCGEYVGKDADE